MTFLFRTAFWLALAIVVLPPDARLGGQETADFRDVDIELEAHNLSFTLWAYASNIMSSCESNPQLCDAAKNLWNTTWETASEIAAATAVEATEKSREIQTAQAKTAEINH